MESHSKNIENEIFEETFDYVIVCNGHNSSPYVPEGDLKNLDEFQGKIIHAHNFRRPDTQDFIHKNILCVGMKWSGMDILYQLTKIKEIRSQIEGTAQDFEESGVDFNKIIISSSAYKVI